MMSLDYPVSMRTCLLACVGALPIPLSPSSYGVPTAHFKVKRCDKDRPGRPAGDFVVIELAEMEQRKVE